MRRAENLYATGDLVPFFLTARTLECAAPSNNTAQSRLQNDFAVLST